MHAACEECVGLLDVSMPKVDAIPMVDPMPLVNPIPMVDAMPMVDPIPMVNTKLHSRSMHPISHSLRRRSIEPLVTPTDRINAVNYIQQLRYINQPIIDGEKCGKRFFKQTTRF